MQPTTSNAPGQIITKGKYLYTSITINADMNKVWDLLMDFAAYPSWNPFIVSITGNAAKGNRITATICPPGSKGMKMQPTILQCIPNKELRWLGSLGIPYIFDGEHTFRLEDNGNGSTTLHHYERFRGLLVPFLSKMLDINTLQGFELMNAALKKKAEQ